MKKKNAKKTVETTETGAKIIRNTAGEVVYDLRNSNNLLRDMNKALIKLTDKSGGSQRGATEWFIESIKKGQLIVPEDDNLIEAVIENARSRKANKMYLELPGRMFAFMYHPKTRAKMRYYDLTPLIITIGMLQTGSILGINLHYIEADLRAELLDKMLRFSSPRYGEKMPAKGSGMFYHEYPMLKSIKFIESLPCVRAYDPRRIIGTPVLIPSNEWGNAVALPMENFVKATDTRVHLESRLKIRELIRKI